METTITRMWYMDAGERLRRLSRSELLEMFKNELKLTEDHEAKIAELYGSYFRLKLDKAEAKRDGNINKVKEIDERLRKIREELEVVILIRKYRKLYEDMVREGFGTTQKISNDFLIQAIANIRTCRLRSSIKGKRLRTKMFRYPYDWAGYNINKYPRWIGLDPDKVRCENCRHWEKEGQLCLLSGRRVTPVYRCAEFGRRGL